MTGFPGEREEEVMDIVNISRELSDLRKEFFKSSAEVKVSVNAFIPKPHTPFQWLGMKPEKDLFHARAALIRQNSKKIQISVFNLRQAELEAAMARGDRRLGKVIYSAWEKGAVMDGTLDHFTRDIWDKAFEEHALTIDQFARHNYSIDDPLPWDHIITEVNKNVLIKELMESGFYKRN
jgi:radical SAM superfamily enzyme YgiQ (UPF0313 family)